MGSSRLLGKLFCEDINISDSLVVKTLNANDITAASVTTSGLTVNGNATTTGTLNVGNSQTNGKISINGKVSIRDYANNGWLGINDTLAWTNGVYFGKTTVRTDGIFQLGDTGNRVLFNQSSAKFSIPVTINNSLAANNITATNVTVNDTLKAFKYELNTIQDLGGEFCVAPIIYIQSGAKVQVNKDSATTIVVSIQDTNAIKSDTIQGVRWAEKSKIKFQGKINGLSIRCNGVMKSKLNTVQNTMSLILTVDSNIANSFSTSVANATSYSDISVMLYQRVTKNSQAKDVYYPVGIRMSATGSTNSAPYVDIWGSKSNSDPDTVYTVPSVRLGYLDGLSTTLNGISISCNGYGLYADNVYLNGTIMSNSGSIGGFKIDYNSFTNGTWGTDKSVLMSIGTTENKAIGGSSAISGWCFTAGSKFGVTTSGDLYASNANISGKVNATSGTIGGFNITDGSLYTGLKSNYNVDNVGIYMDKNGQIAFGDVSNYIRYYKNASDQYKIDIQTDNISINDNDGVIIGNRKGLRAYITEDHFLIDGIVFLGYGDLLSDPDEHTTGAIARLPYFTLGERLGETSSIDDIGAYSFAVGRGNKASGYASCAEGYQSIASGKLSHAEGNSTTASGGISHAEGEKTTASGRGSHAEGDSTTASGWYSHAEGFKTEASGDYSHAANNGSVASGDNSTAINGGNASGEGSLAVFTDSQAKHTYAAAIGQGAVTGKNNQTVIGYYNDPNLNTSALLVVGAGQDANNRRNVYAVGMDGSVWSSVGTYNGVDIGNHVYREGRGSQFNTSTPLLINGNSLNLATAQLILEYNDSYIRFRNDGSSFYIMNGNASSWTNYITFQSTGGVVVPNTLKVPTQLYIPYATKASTTSAANAYISADGNGVLAKTSKTSSRRFKDSITTDLDEELNPEHLYDIDVVQFKYKKDYFTNTDDIRYRKNLIGLIAENVYDNYKIAADWHVDEESGKVLVDAWNEQYIVQAMLKLIQEQHKEIEKLKQIIGGE